MKLAVVMLMIWASASVLMQIQNQSLLDSYGTRICRLESLQKDTFLLQSNQITILDGDAKIFQNAIQVTVNRQAQLEWELGFVYAHPRLDTNSLNSLQYQINYLNGVTARLSHGGAK